MSDGGVLVDRRGQEDLLAVPARVGLQAVEGLGTHGGVGSVHGQILDRFPSARRSEGLQAAEGDTGRPVLGLAMSVFLFSLAGIPPTGGFFGKYAIFQAAIASKQYLLATVGVLNAVVAAYYYLRVIVAMYMSTPETDEEPLPVTPTMAAVVIVSVVAVLYLGLAPSGLLNTARELLASVI